MVAETAYPFTMAKRRRDQHHRPGLGAGTGYAATPAGQAANLRDVLNVVEAVPNGLGLGVFYWEPTWTAVTGNGWDPTNPSSGDGWENQALFDYSGRALPAMQWFDHR